MVPMVNNTVFCTSKFVKRIDYAFTIKRREGEREVEGERERRKLWEVLDMFITLIVVMVSQVLTL